MRLIQKFPQPFRPEVEDIFSITPFGQTIMNLILRPRPFINYYSNPVVGLCVKKFCFHGSSSYIHMGPRYPFLHYTEG